ncbi:MAG: hypothetical protein C4567_18355 [Deltaproteobacteria bacterium]|nr:MAG: hypothetical protein C4567_18355 [Deltaproteobacteria bacterium]
MEETNPGDHYLFGRSKEIFRTLAADIVLIHHRQVPAETQIIIRFANGYGAALLPLSTGKDAPILEMLVLRFHGPKINDHKLAQYAAVPEINRGNFREIMELCRQVSLWPQNRTLNLCPGHAAPRNEEGDGGKRCSNY